MVLSWRPGSFGPYNKSFIDQACLVKMVGYWPPVLRFYGPRLSLSVKTQKII